MDDVQKTRLRTPRRLRIWPHKLWLKLFQARRALRRTLKATSASRAAWLEEKEYLTDRYEHELALERARFTRMQQELISRVVQLAGQQPILDTDLVDDVTHPKYMRPHDQGRLEDTLSDEAHQFFLDRRDDFITEGEEQGLSPAEIKLKWAEVKERAIEDAANSVL